MTLTVVGQSRHHFPKPQRVSVAMWLMNDIFVMLYLRQEFWPNAMIRESIDSVDVMECASGQMGPHINHQSCIGNSRLLANLLICCRKGVDLSF